MILESLPGNGIYPRRWHWEPLEDGSVRSWGLVSPDNGETWQATWDITYRRPPAAEPHAKEDPSGEEKR